MFRMFYKTPPDRIFVYVIDFLHQKMLSSQGFSVPTSPPNMTNSVV